MSHKRNEGKGFIKKMGDLFGLFDIRKRPAEQAHGLTLLCPIINGNVDGDSFSALTRDKLYSLELDEKSPFALVPETYLYRAYVMDDVIYQEGKDVKEEHLKSSYLVMVADYHGDKDTYLKGMWSTAAESMGDILKYCVAFDDVLTQRDFVRYMKKCEVKTTFFFNGSTDEPRDIQLKALYLKQEFTRFVHKNQNKSAEDLQQAFRKFAERTKPNQPLPRWIPGSDGVTQE